MNSSVLAAVLLLSSGQAGPIEPVLSPNNNLLQDRETAEAFDYCAWYHEAKPAEANVPDLIPLMMNETGVVSVETQAAAIVADAGMNVARATNNQKACNKVFRQGRKLHNKLIASNLKRMKKASTYDPSTNAELESVQAGLMDLWVRDQAYRGAYSRAYTDKNSGKKYWARRLAGARIRLIDAEATKHMKGLLANYDWIDVPRFGKSASNWAWLLVQHADNDPEFQSFALARMEPYLETEGIKKSNYAYLWDRVAVNTDRKQRYGTQPIWGECVNGQLSLAPLENPDTVNERRAMLGMGSIENDLAQMSHVSCGR